MRLPTFKQLDAAGVDAGKLLDAYEEAAYRNLGLDASPERQRHLRRALYRLNERRAEYFGFGEPIFTGKTKAPTAQP